MLTQALLLGSHPQPWGQRLHPKSQQRLQMVVIPASNQHR
jgi:hypothetical protein